jgi:hypothetical protein
VRMGSCAARRSCVPRGKSGKGSVVALVSDALDRSGAIAHFGSCAGRRGKYGGWPPAANQNLCTFAVCF